MKYLLIILLFLSCSCASTTFTINGQEVKQKTKPIGTEEKIIIISGFLFGYAMAPIFIKP